MDKEYFFIIRTEINFLFLWDQYDVPIQVNKVGWNKSTFTNKNITLRLFLNNLRTVKNWIFLIYVFSVSSDINPRNRVMDINVWFYFYSELIFIVVIDWRNYSENSIGTIYFKEYKENI